MKKPLSILLFLLLSSPQLMAAQAVKNKPLLDKNKFSIGAGITHNSVRSFDEIGLQFFFGYDLNKVNLMDGVNTSIEFGYIDYGFSSGNNDDGLWGTAVVDGVIKGKLGWLARAGLDVGDDSGLMIGAGVGLNFNAQTALRLEYVIRDEVDSLQLNLHYHL